MGDAMIEAPAQHWQSSVPGPDVLGPADLAEANCFYEPALLDPALDLFRDGTDVRIIEASDSAGRLIGRLPILCDQWHGRFPARHVANWVYPHCYYGAPLLREGSEQNAWAAMLATLDRANWSGDFLHLRLIDPQGPVARALIALCAAERRPLLEIQRHERAMLDSNLAADAYWTAKVRAKKRKELRRQHSRLAEHGHITHSVLDASKPLDAWCDAFLKLEARGWKGTERTALLSRERDARFFRTACANAWAQDGLDMLRIDCDERPIAMLVSFVGPRGGFAFKTAFDPDFARYSPGVLVEIDNLERVLDHRRAPWMDSCAVPDHPMIESLWGERRAIAQYRIALRKKGWRGLKARASRTTITGVERLAGIIRQIGTT